MKKDFLSITCVSDTHGTHPRDYFNDYYTAGGDVLIHAGDISSHTQKPDAIKFCHDWASLALRYEKFFVGLGNHDECFYYDDDFYEIVYEMKNIIPNLILIREGKVEYNELIFAFMPYIPTYKNYNFSASEDELALRLERIGYSDILVTHIPSKGILDSYHVNGETFMDGSTSVRSHIEKYNPAIHVCGHVHSASGVFLRPRGISINAAVAGKKQKIKLLSDQTFVLNTSTMLVEYYQTNEKKAG